MNYKRFLKRRNKLINDIKNSFVENLGDDFTIEYMNVSEYYKDELLNILLKYKHYEIMLYVHLDFINLDITKTIFEYSIFNDSKNLIRDKIKYIDLIGNDTNEKIRKFRNLLEQKIKE